MSQGIKIVNGGEEEEDDEVKLDQPRLVKMSDVWFLDLY